MGLLHSLNLVGLVACGSCEHWLEKEGSYQYWWSLACAVFNHLFMGFSFQGLKCCYYNLYQRSKKFPPKISSLVGCMWNEDFCLISSKLTLFSHFTDWNLYIKYIQFMNFRRSYRELFRKLGKVDELTDESVKLWQVWKNVSHVKWK